MMLHLAGSPQGPPSSSTSLFFFSGTTSFFSVFSAFVVDADAAGTAVTDFSGVPCSQAKLTRATVS